jgi:hypothetical protein
MISSWIWDSLYQKSQKPTQNLCKIKRQNLPVGDCQISYSVLKLSLLRLRELIQLDLSLNEQMNSAPIHDWKSMT